ncbi:hypothetical protein [Streptomyces sp. NPDC046821]|uniref:hypothetical protein n=1 Tax=Streptomyces sp. NPDC046821 TaxID=3154702 RepID=UPI0033CDFE20
MRDPRAQGSARWNYPDTRTYTPSTFDNGRFRRAPQPTIIILVALTAAAIGLFLLSKDSDVKASTPPKPKDVTSAVHEEVQKMFIADLRHSSRVIRSDVIPTSAHERIDYPQDALALRCYGNGSLNVRTILKNGTTKKHTAITCGGTDVTVIANEADTEAIIITPKGPDTWASWALTRPPSTATDL